MPKRHEILEQGMALQMAKKYPKDIPTEQLLSALGRVTGIGKEELSIMFTQRTKENHDDSFAALMDFLDDCFRRDKNERRPHK